MRKLLFTSVLCAVLLTGAGVAHGQGPPRTEGRSSPAVRSLTNCLEQSNRLSVLFLIDESSSLKDDPSRKLHKRGSDPQGRRAEGLQAALAGFARLADAKGDKNGPPEVRYLMMAFSGKVTPDPFNVEPVWKRLDVSTIDAALEEAESFKARDDGSDTDYALALDAARKALRDESSARTSSGRPPCKALVWFTDGKYNISTRGGGNGLPLTVPYDPGRVIDNSHEASLVVQEGRRHLCGSDGLMDALQEDKVVKFTVALSSRDQPIDRRSESFLQNLTRGGNEDAQCSGLLKRWGDYLKIRDTGCLFFAFGSLLEGGGCPDELKRPRECVPQQRCELGTDAFQTVPGLDRFLVRAHTGEAGIAVYLTGPDGKQSAPLTPDGDPRLLLSGAEIHQRWVSERAVEIEAKLPPGKDWVGPWSVKFVDPTGNKTSAITRSRHRLYADLQPRLRPSDTAQVVRGDTVPAHVILAKPNGDIVTEGPLRDATLAAFVDDGVQLRPAVVGERAADGSYEIPVTVAQSFTASKVALHVDAEFAASKDIVIAQQHAAIEFDVVPPKDKGIPALTSSELRLPDIKGKGSTRGVIAVNGSPFADGCVWIETPTPASIGAPADAKPIRFRTATRMDSESSCLKVPQGKARDVPVFFDVSDDSYGTARTKLRVHLNSESADGGRNTKNLDVSFGLRPEPNTGVRLAIFLGVLLAGIAISLGTLQFLNFLGARFTPLTRLRSLAQNVVVTPHVGITGADDGPVKTNFLRAFEPMSTVGTDKQEPNHRIELPTTADGQFGGTLELRAIPTRTFLDLFNGPVGVAEYPGRRLLAGSRQRLRTWDHGRLHEVPLSLPGTWIFIPVPPVASPDAPELDPEGQPVSGTLVMLIDNSSIDAGELLADEAAAVLSRHQWSTFQIAYEPKPEKLGWLRRLRPGRRERGQRQVDPAPDEYGDMSALDDDPQWDESPSAPGDAPPPPEPGWEGHSKSTDLDSDDDEWDRP